MYDTDDAGGTTRMTQPPIYNVYNENLYLDKARGETRASPRSHLDHLKVKKEPQRKGPKRMMDKTMPPPVERSKVQTAAVMEKFEYPIKMGSSSFVMHEADKKFFIAFLPSLVQRAIEDLHRASRNGERIHNPVAWMFSRCVQLTEENNRS
jgi:hypothetical protein